MLVIKHDLNVEEKKKTKINNLKKVKDLGMIIDVKFKEIVKAFLDL
jgi:hypothetical protein